jgi:hypothetical protein
MIGGTVPGTKKGFGTRPSCCLCFVWNDSPQRGGSGFDSIKDRKRPIASVSAEPLNSIHSIGDFWVQRHFVVI